MVYSPNFYQDVIQASAHLQRAFENICRMHYITLFDLTSHSLRHQPSLNSLNLQGQELGINAT
jgi:hypothetical protein